MKIAYFLSGSVWGQKKLKKVKKSKKMQKNKKKLDKIFTNLVIFTIHYYNSNSELW